MSSIRDGDVTDEPDDDGSGTLMRGKVCEIVETSVKAYGKFQLLGILDKSQKSQKSLFVMLSSLSV